MCFNLHLGAWEKALSNEDLLQAGGVKGKKLLFFGVPEYPAQKNHFWRLKFLLQVISNLIIIGLVN